MTVVTLWGVMLVRVRPEQKAATRTALLQAGADLIRSKGFSAVTVEEITAQAGVAKGTFYNYFTAKEDLVIAALTESRQEGMAQVGARLAAIPRTADRITLIFRHVCQWVDENPELTWVYCVERIRRGYGPADSDPGASRTILAHLLAGGQEQGEVRGDRQAELMAGDLEGLMLVNVAAWYFQGHPCPLYQLLGPAIDTYLRGALVSLPEGGEGQP